jgi:type I restriction enzyme S subunit
VKSIGELVTVFGGGTPRKSVANYYGGPIPWVTPKDMKQPVIATSEILITQEGVKNSSVKLVPAGSVLIVVRSGVLKHTLPVALTTAPVTVNQDMKALVPSKGVHGPYLARLIKALQPRVLGWVRATTADNFPINNLLDLKVKVPSLDEQRRIAAVLDHADGLRDKRRGALRYQQDLPRAVFRDMFGRSNGPCATIAGLALPQKGSIRTGPFGSQLLHSEFVDQGIAVLGLDNVVGNEFTWGERRYITAEKYDALRRYTVRPGDVLMSIMGTCGRCVVVPSGIETAINTKHICAVTVDPQKAIPDF